MEQDSTLLEVEYMLLSGQANLSRSGIFLTTKFQPISPMAILIPMDGELLQPISEAATSTALSIINKSSSM